MYDLDILTQLQMLTNRLELIIYILIFNTSLFLYFVMRSGKK